MLPGALTPPLQAHLTRLGSRLSFADAASELWHLKGVTVSAATARRRTEAAGAIAAAHQDRDAAQALADPPPPRRGPAVQQVSVDGAMAPLSDGSWREVRTLAIGTVTPDPPPGAIRCTELSYFARLADAATFTDLAAGEVQRRGVETAGVVAGVVDGADWCQTFLDAHCPEAIRILDFAHAAQRLSDVAEAIWGSDARAQVWAATQRRRLRDDDPALVLAAIRALPLADAADGPMAAQAQQATLGYLEPRLAQMRYAAFRTQGLPIGSGMVESANKLVVEARLKGAGRRWAEANVNSMLALRSALCSGRWAETWATIAQARRGGVPAAPAARPAASAASAASVAVPPRRQRSPGSPTLPRVGPKRIVDGRPTPCHPWKRSPVRVTPPPAKL